MLKNLRNRYAMRHFMVLLYLAGALFFQNFHEHAAGYFLRDFQFKNPSASVKSNKENISATDCAACSLHYAGSVVVPKPAALELYTVPAYSGASVGAVSGLSARHHHYHFLRGPPGYI